MPRPQAGTPTDVALADVDTGIQLGIEGHSVRAGRPRVKLESGELVVKPLPRASTRTTVPGSMPGKGVDAKRSLAAILAIAIFSLRS
jgi:hypothetical protein